MASFGFSVPFCTYGEVINLNKKLVLFFKVELNSPASMCHLKKPLMLQKIQHLSSRFCRGSCAFYSETMDTHLLLLYL